ncbi:MAG: hypothetical protein OEW08_09090, partial [Gammaproteobacteria bacterium]|nr:hypothetical protein [Gammaproteobacteria bacterium]
LLLQARGGTFLRVPIYPEFARVLSAIVNEYSVRALCAAFGDQTLELPKCDKIIRQLRDHAIRIERQRRSCAAVARDYNLTRRQVINITHDIDDGQQPDMFS